jgi:hypothetical protein
VAHKATAKPRALVLPLTVASPADVGRLIHELELIDDALLQLGLRKGGTEVKMPVTSRLMDQTIQANKLNLLQKDDLAGLRQFLAEVKQKSPVLHISFSADPPPSFMEKLMAWLRREIHPTVMVTSGLQPNIGAGCIVRTANKQFDFSLRQDFMKKRELLLSRLAVPEAKTAAPTEVKKAPA